VSSVAIFFYFLPENEMSEPQMPLMAQMAKIPKIKIERCLINVISVISVISGSDFFFISSHLPCRYSSTGVISA
jgi:hypothetical protein